MLVAIHQLHYLPWLRYFEKIGRADAFIVLDDVQFAKNDWQNRNKIKTAQGATVLTLPVEQKHQQPLNEVRINNRVNWRRKHWETLRQAYGSAPFFAEMAVYFESVYSKSWERMNDLNREMLGFFLRVLDMETPIHYSSELGMPGEATERLINLIKAVGGTRYYSGKYALQVYLDERQLTDAGIGLELQRWTAPVYEQLHGEFIPDLSIVDLLFNHGPEARRILMG